MPESSTALAPGGEPPSLVETLMRAHYVRLCDFAFRLVHSRDIAEDIVQDVFTQLWRNRDDLELQDPLRYLYQAVRNRVINHRRRQGVREGWEQYVTTMTDEAATDKHLESVVEATDLASAYVGALNELPERCRLVFVMSREHGLTYPEIARALDLSIKTVETQIGRALKLLRLRLRPYLGIALAVLSSGRFLA